MFSKALKKATFPSFVSKKFFASSNQGNLYTWGAIPAGLGYKVSPYSEEMSVPKLIQEFNGNVSKVSMGPHHTAVVTQDGSLYTFGYDRFGNLGQNTIGGLVLQPTLLSFFQTNNLKVADVACGKDHTVALTEDGDVYTWGHGGYKGYLRDLLMPSIGPLGQGGNAHRSLPTPVETLRGLPRIQSISTGLDFSFALNAENDIYNWGKGHHGVFGVGSHADLKVPTLNAY